jgi:hypothetical protein
VSSPGELLEPPARRAPEPGVRLALPLAELLAMEARWPQLAALHASSQSSSPSYFRRHAMSSLAACSRAEMTAALLAQRARGPSVPLSDEVLLAVTLLHGTSRHGKLLSLLSGGLRSLCTAWRADDAFLHDALAAVRSVVALPALFGGG